jgi:large conductance mechanosensitive channel
MLQGFKAFITRGNVLDLAVAVVIGAAFTDVINGVVNHLLNPIIGAIFGKPDLSNVWDVTLRPAHDDVEAAVISVGGVLNPALNFLIVAATIYFIVIVPINKLMSLRKRGAEPEPKAPAEDVLVLQEIRDLLRAQVQEQQRR